MAYQAVIFDLDGVLCHTDEYHYLAWKKLADSLGLRFDRGINGRLRGVSRMASLEIILEQYSGPALTAAEKMALAEKKNDAYRESLRLMTPADLPEEVRTVLDTLRDQGLRLAVGSSSKNAPFILGQLNLSDFFDAVSDGNNITRSKPNPEVFLKAAELLNWPSKSCLVVEDAISGAQAGHAGGFMVACVGDAAKAKAGDYNLDCISELLNVAWHGETGQQAASAAAARKNKQK